MFSSLFQCVFDCKRNCTESDQDGAESENNALMQGVQKSDDECEPSEIVSIDVASLAAATVVQTGEMFKLDIDCYEEAFDYLPIEGLVNVGKTCKRLQQVAGYCFQQNYSEIICGINYRGNVTIDKTNIDHFTAFVRKIRVLSKDLQYLVNTQSKFHRLKQMEVDGLFLHGSCNIAATKIILSKLEVLCVKHCELSSDFHEVTNHCTKLKRLEIVWCKGKFNWHDYRYPTLEYFNIWDPCNVGSTESISKFLELNPNIRKFATNARFISELQDKFMSPNVKLDDLAIRFSPMYLYSVNSLGYSLNELFQRDFYKKLHFYFMLLTTQEEIYQLAAVNGLMKLVACVWDGSFAFSSLTNLEELYLNNSRYVADLYMLPTKLINLKRIQFDEASIGDIMLFIRRSVGMQRIKVDRLKDGVHFNSRTEIIDLLALNREREQLPDARKITLFVEEKIYLATKWAMKGNDFGLIRLKRKESFDWGHDFS